MVDSPEKEPRTTVVEKELEMSEVKSYRALRRKAAIKPVPEVEKVSPEVRHTHVLRQKAALKPMIEERRRRQKESQQHLKKSITEPTSGHKSPRPNRHISKRRK